MQPLIERGCGWHAAFCIQARCFIAIVRAQDSQLCGCWGGGLLRVIRLLVVVVQFFVAWSVAPLIMRFMVPVTLYAVSGYLSALLAATLVWLAGFAAAQVLSGTTQPTLPGFAAAVAAALVVRALLHFIATQDLQDLNVLPAWGIPALVIAAAISGYWSAEDQAELPFDGGLVFVVIVSLFGAALGSFAAIVMMHTALPPGTYPRALIALPFLVGATIGLGIGTGLAHLVLYPF